MSAEFLPFDVLLICPKTYQKCTKNPSIQSRCTKIHCALVCRPAKLCKRLPHHVENSLAIPLKDSGIALPQHQRHEVVSDSANAELRRKRVTQLIKRNVVRFGPVQRGSPSLSDAAKVRLAAAFGKSRKQVLRPASLLQIFLEGSVSEVGHGCRPCLRI